MAAPRLLILDEPSLDLPVGHRDGLRHHCSRQGTTNFEVARRTGGRTGPVGSRSRVRVEDRSDGRCGTVAELAEDAAVREAYLGEVALQPEA